MKVSKNYKKHSYVERVHSVSETYSFKKENLPSQ